MPTTLYPEGTKEDVKEVRGVSLRFLSDFASKVPADLSTSQIVAQFVAPKCEGTGEAFVDLVSPKYVGPAQHYVIHAWGCCFLSDLVVPLLQHFIGDPHSDPAARASALSNTFIWIDCFSCPLLTGSGGGRRSSGGDEALPRRPVAVLSARLAVVDTVLRQCRSALLMLDSSATALGRTWCLYEVARVLALKGPQFLHVPIFDFPLDIVYATLQSINLAASKAYSAADQQDLLAVLSLEQGEGSESAGHPGRGRGQDQGAASVPTSGLSGLLGAATCKIAAGIQDSLVGEAQQLIRAGVRSGPRYLACLRKAAEALRLGKAPLAEALALAAVKEHRKAHGDNDASTLNALSNLALLRRSQGSNGEAEELLRQVLEGRRSLLGREHPDTAASCDHLAWLLQESGKLEEAAQLYQEALDISCKGLGENHPDTASSCNNLAGVLQSLGRLDEAEPLLKRSLEVTKHTLGERHPHTATNYNNLGVLYRSKGDVHTARENFQAAYDITVSVHGSEHADTATACHNLALALQAEGRLKEAEQLLRQCRESIEAYLGLSHAATRSILAALGLVLKEQGRLDEAGEVLRLLEPSRAPSQAQQDPQPPQQQDKEQVPQQLMKGGAADSIQRPPSGLAVLREQQTPAPGEASATTMLAASPPDNGGSETQVSGTRPISPSRSQVRQPDAVLDPETAAVRIQAYHRGHQARKQVAEMRSKAAAAAAGGGGGDTTSTAAKVPEAVAAGGSAADKAAGTTVTAAGDEADVKGAAAAAQEGPAPEGLAPRREPAASWHAGDKEAAAAVRIQAYHRGHLARRKVAKMRRTSGTGGGGGGGGQVKQPVAAAMAGLAAAAASMPSLQLPHPFLSTRLSDSVFHSLVAPPAPPLLPNGSARRPPSRNAAIVHARETLRSGGISGTSSLPFYTPRPAGSTSYAGGPTAPELRTTAWSYGGGPVATGPGAPPATALASTTVVPTTVTGTRSRCEDVATPFVSLQDYFRAPDAALRAIGSLPRVDRSQRSSIRMSESIESVLLPPPPWIDPATAPTPRADDLLELHADMLGSALSQLRLRNARDKVIRSGAETRAVLQLKLAYIRLAVDQALSAVEPQEHTSTRSSPPLGSAVMTAETTAAVAAAADPPLRSTSTSSGGTGGGGGIGHLSGLGQGVLSAVTGDLRCRRSSCSSGAECQGTAGGPQAVAADVLRRHSSCSGSGSGVGGQRPRMAQQPGEELQRPANHHGMPRLSLQLQPQNFAGQSGGKQVAWGTQSGSSSGRQSVREDDVQALMTELTELRTLLLTTNSALSAANRGLHQERATRQALVSELAELQRKLSTVLPSKHEAPGPASHAPSSRSLLSGGPLSPSPSAPGPYASAPVVGAALSGSRPLAPQGPSTRPIMAAVRPASAARVRGGPSLKVTGSAPDQVTKNLQPIPPVVPGTKS